MKPKTYFGWTNYETWCVALWLDNDSWTYNQCKQQAARCWKQARKGYRLQDIGSDQAENAIRELSTVLKEKVEESQPDVKGLYADLLGSAMSEVDWYEIANHYMDDVRDEIESREAEHKLQNIMPCKRTDKAIDKMEAAQNADCNDEQPRESNSLKKQN